jgi:predicted ester cyclase
MTKAERNKQFIQNYHRELLLASQKSSDALWEKIHQYVAAQKLIDHITYLKESFPNYILVIEESIAEGDRVFEKVTFAGSHDGEIDEIPATHQEIAVPFAICYTVKDDKIVDFWAIANEMDFFEQIGMAREQVEVRPED